MVFYIAKLPEKDDPYAYLPFTEMYIAIATCVVYLQRFHASQNSFYTTRQSDHEFCNNYNLTVCGNELICRMNIEELIMSLSQLELKLRHIPFKPELIYYVDALEIRVCEILMNVYGSQVQNVVSFRHALQGNDRYACTKTTDFTLTAHILCIRRELGGAVAWWRRLNGQNIPPTISDPEMEGIRTIHNSLIRECQRLHGEIQSRTFRSRYIDSSLRASEYIHYLKENPGKTTVDHTVAIKKYRSVAQWRCISTTAFKDMDGFLYYMKDPLAFRIIMACLLDVQFRSRCNVSWYVVYITSQNFTCLSQEQITDLKIRSEGMPFLVESLNDACIIWDKKIHVFGSEPICYMRALYHWLNIMRRNYKNKMEKKVDISRFVSLLLFNKTPHEKVEMASKDIIETVKKSASAQLFKTAEEIREENAAKVINTIDETIQVSVTNIWQDTDELGTSTSQSCAWDNT
jgi:hypothetical protein